MSNIKELSPIKQLNGLKVEAIAIPVKEGLGASVGMIYGERHLCFKNSPANILLPPGNWSIIGRCNEFTMTHIAKMLPENLNNENIQAYGFEEWQSYCAANNLTNELILISNE